MGTNNTGQIYTLLVTEAEKEGYPLEGYIAYSLYKKEKIKFIEDFTITNPYATESTIQKAKDTFRKNHSKNEEIRRYRLLARKVIEEIRVDDLKVVNLESINTAINKERDILNELLNTKLSDHHNKSKKNWFGKGVLTSFTGTLIYPLILIFTGVIIVNSPNIEKLINYIANLDSTSTTSQKENASLSTEDTILYNE